MEPMRDVNSQLPIDILDHILGFLPIKEAAKRAMLSTIWRDVWSTLTQLKFDDRFFYHIDRKHLRISKYARQCVGLSVMNKVLLQHKGTIRKFVFEFSKAEIFIINSRSFDFDRWLLLVTQKGVEEIYLSFKNATYRLPNCIFSCSTLKRLHVCGVIVEPMDFRCILPNVASICFDRVDFHPKNLQGCSIDAPVLENMSFLNCQNMFHFNITAPKLCSLTIKSCSSDMLGKYLPVKLDWSSISTLDLEGYLQVFVKEFSREGFQVNVEHLKLTHFFPHCISEASTLAHLLGLCPKLYKLDIDLYKCDENTTEYVNILHDAAETNKVLHTLKITSFKWFPGEILLIKELVIRFSILKKVVIIHRKCFFDEEFRAMQELLNFLHTSTKAEIILYPMHVLM